MVVEILRSVEGKVLIIVLGQSVPGDGGLDVSGVSLTRGALLRS